MDVLYGDWRLADGVVAVTMAVAKADNRDIDTVAVTMQSISVVLSSPPRSAQQRDSRSKRLGIHVRVCYIFIQFIRLTRRRRWHANDGDLERR